MNRELMNSGTVFFSVLSPLVGLFLKSIQNRLWMTMVHWPSLGENLFGGIFKFLMFETGLAAVTVFLVLKLRIQKLIYIQASFIVLGSVIIDIQSFGIKIEDRYYLLWTFQFAIGIAIFVLSKLKLETNEKNVL